jgi:hypothetical protein
VEDDDEIEIPGLDLSGMDEPVTEESSPTHTSGQSITFGKPTIREYLKISDMFTVTEERELMYTPNYILVRRLIDDTRIEMSEEDKIKLMIKICDQVRKRTAPPSQGTSAYEFSVWLRNFKSLRIDVRSECYHWVHGNEGFCTICSDVVSRRIGGWCITTTLRQQTNSVVDESVHVTAWSPKHDVCEETHAFAMFALDYHRYLHPRFSNDHFHYRLFRKKYWRLYRDARINGEDEACIEAYRRTWVCLCKWGKPDLEDELLRPISMIWSRATVFGRGALIARTLSFKGDIAIAFDSTHFMEALADIYELYKYSEIAKAYEQEYIPTANPINRLIKGFRGI